MINNHMAKHRDELKGQKKTPSSSESRELAKDEPQPLPIVDCPSELGPVARQEWNRVAGALTALGRLTTFDRAPLAAYCNAYAAWLDASEIRQRDEGAVRLSGSITVLLDCKQTIGDHDANCE
jgi:phage terminase small subunit